MRMRLPTILGEILPALGTVGLLGLWFYQQVGIESRSSELRKFAAARAVFQTYQSHNAVFNGLYELSKTDSNASKQIRVLQDYNYEFGLAAMEAALPESAKTGIPRPVPFGTDPTAAANNQLQRRLETLQQRLHDVETATAQSADAAKRRYLWSFLALSCLSIGGSVFRAYDKLSAR